MTSRVLSRCREREKISVLLSAREPLITAPTTKIRIKTAIPIIPAKKNFEEKMPLCDFLTGRLAAEI